MDQTYMKEQPVLKLIVSMALPMVISMMVSSLYNIVDSFFIARISEDAMTALSLVYPVQNLINAVMIGFGIGINAVISFYLGAQDKKMADRAATQGMLLGTIHGVGFMILGIAVMRPFLQMFTGNAQIVDYGVRYSRIAFLFATALSWQLVFEKTFQAVGRMVESMTCMMSGAIINIILDPIFIFGLNLGISGAALATALSQCISFGILFFQSLLRKDCVHLKPGKITLSLSLYGEIFHGGIPSLCRQGVASIATAALNVAANPFGDAAIAALSIVSRYMMFIGSAMIGFGQGFQPVCGFNFGAKRYDRVLEAFWFCVKVAVVFLVTLSVVSFVGAPQIMRIFRKEDLDVIEIGTWALRFQCVTLPLSAWIVMSNMMTQTIGYGFRASLVAAGRQGLFLIPALFVLPVKFGIRGLQLCQPVADALTFVLGVVIVLGILRELKEKQEQVE